MLWYFTRFKKKVKIKIIDFSILSKWQNLIRFRKNTNSSHFDQGEKSKRHKILHFTPLCSVPFRITTNYNQLQSITKHDFFSFFLFFIIPPFIISGLSVFDHFPFTVTTFTISKNYSFHRSRQNNTFVNVRRFGMDAYVGFL